MPRLRGSSVWRRSATRWLAALATALVAAPLLVLTGTVPAASAANALLCTPGYAYSVSGGGQLRQVAPDGVVTRIGSGEWAGSSLDALAISANGAGAFAIERGLLNPKAVSIRKYDPATGQFSNVSGSYNTSMDGIVVAGAVDLATGDYLFGGFSSISVSLFSRELTFKIFRYQPGVSGSAAFSVVGEIRTGETYSILRPAADGDMAFDEAGNLYVVHAEGGAVRVSSASRETLAGAGGGFIAAQTTPIQSTAFRDVSGIAFSADGTVLLGNGTRADSYDPATWQLIGNRTNALQNSTDLASCSSPSSISLRKDVGSRAVATDQFALTLADGNLELGTRTTAGSASGIQGQVVGPFPVRAGKSIRFWESGAIAADLAKYSSSWVCRDERDGRELARGNGASGEVLIPSPSGILGARIVCDVRNDVRSTLTLVNDVDTEFGGTLQPADWTLFALSPGGARADFASGERREIAAGTHVIGGDPKAGYALESISCVAGGTTLTVDAQHAVTIPAGADAVCTLVNRDLSGSVAWQKVDSVTGALIGGSGWKLSGPGGDVAVVDNVGEPSYAGLDEDPEPGKFKVGSLHRGEHQLTETIPPEGYALATSGPIAFDVTDEALEVTLAAVANRLLLEFGLEKYSYASAGQLAPELLDGAAFEVREDAGGSPGATVPGAVVRSGAGAFRLAGLPAGDYWLVETASPAGYSRLAEAIGFTVLHDASHPQGAIRLLDDADPLVELDATATIIRVSDARTVGLPMAGGEAGFDTLSAGLLVLGVAASVLIAVRVRRAHSRTTTERK